MSPGDDKPDCSAAVPLQALKVRCLMSYNPQCIMVFKPLKQGKTMCHLKIYETLNFFQLNPSQSIIIRAYQNNHQACKTT